MIFERARQLVILPEPKKVEGVGLALITEDFKNGKWLIKAIRPDYKTTKKINDGSQKEQEDSFHLDVYTGVLYYLDILIKKRKELIGNSENESFTTSPFSSKTADELLQSLKKLLREIDPTGRLTINKLSTFMFGQLLEQSRGDICAASMVAGVGHPLAHVRMFYSMIHVSKIQKHYFDSVKQVVELVQQARDVLNKMKDRPLSSSTRFLCRKSVMSNF